MRHSACRGIPPAVGRSPKLRRAPYVNLDAKMWSAKVANSMKVGKLFCCTFPDQSAWMHFYTRTIGAQSSHPNNNFSSRGSRASRIFGAYLTCVSHNSKHLCVCFFVRVRGWLIPGCVRCRGALSSLTWFRHAPCTYSEITTYCSVDGVWTRCRSRAPSWRSAWKPFGAVIETIGRGRAKTNVVMVLRPFAVCDYSIL